MELNEHDPKYNLSKMILDNFTWSIFGIIIGLVVNNISVKMFEHFKIKNKLMQNLLQILLCSVVLANIHININNYFGWSWQNITPGLFFTSFFFGVQYRLFANLNELAYLDTIEYE